MITGSAALQGRGQRLWAAHEDAIAGALADLLGIPAPDPAPQILAHQILGIHPLALRMAELWSTQDVPDEQVKQRVLDLIERSFDLLEAGLARPA